MKVAIVAAAPETMHLELFMPAMIMVCQRELGNEVNARHMAPALLCSLI